MVTSFIDRKVSAENPPSSNITTKLSQLGRTSKKSRQKVVLKNSKRRKVG
jgi:hypothetical protein